MKKKALEVLNLNYFKYKSKNSGKGSGGRKRTSITTSCLLDKDDLTESEFDSEQFMSENEEITLGVFSWNMNGTDPPNQADFFAQLIAPTDEEQIPGLFVVGLQETIQLNAINVLKGHDSQ